MPTVGRTLASERARQRLDLEDVARITKIGVRALRSIENDDFEQLPGYIFARNFVRQYAQCLKLDDAVVVAQFDREQASAAPEPTATAREIPQFSVSPITGSTLAKIFDSNTVSAFVSFVLTLAVCAGAFAAYQYWRSHNTASVVTHTRSAPGPSAVKPPAKPAAVPPLPAEPAPVNAGLAPLDSPQIATADAKVHAVLRASEPCWTRVTADGKILFAGVLAAGDSRAVNAAEKIEVRAGNAGALEIQANGNDVPPIGPKGQIRTAVITEAGTQVRTPTLDPDFR